MRLGFLDILGYAAIQDFRDRKRKEAREKEREGKCNNNIAVNNIRENSRQELHGFCPWRNELDFLQNIDTFIDYSVSINDRIPRVLILELDEARDIWQTRLLAVLQENANDLESRCELTELLITYINEFAPFENIDYFISECRNLICTVIDMTGSNDKRDQMIKHYFLALDAELYLIQGDFANALKHYYASLKWEDMLANIYQRESFDLDGSEEFYSSVVSNIVNIYAYLGEPLRAKETRNVFERAIYWANHFSKVQLTESVNEDLLKYVRHYSSALNATEKDIGFWCFSGMSFEGKSKIYNAYCPNNVFHPDPVTHKQCYAPHYDNPSWCCKRHNSEEYFQYF